MKHRKKYRYNIGDEVYINGEIDGIEFKNQKGYICIIRDDIAYKDTYDYGVDFAGTGFEHPNLHDLRYHVDDPVDIFKMIKVLSERTGYFVHEKNVRRIVIDNFDKDGEE